MLDLSPNNMASSLIFISCLSVDFILHEFLIVVMTFTKLDIATSIFFINSYLKMQIIKAKCQTGHNSGDNIMANTALQ